MNLFLWEKIILIYEINFRDDFIGSLVSVV